MTELSLAPIIASDGPATASTSKISLKDIGKTFGSTRALHGVSLDLLAGEIYGLIGANGAGKSTLIKILCGAHRDYEGSLEIDGVTVRFANPLDARSHGIEAVHQHVEEGIVPGLSVAENLILDELASKRSQVVFSARRATRLASVVAKEFGLDFSASQLRGDIKWLSVSEKQLVVLARALHRSPRLLILDEPTASLSSTESDRLFAILNQLSGSGVAVLYVSHRLGEVEHLAQRIGVLRNGGLTATFAPPYDTSEIVSSMLGARLAAAKHDSRPGKDDVLVLSGVEVLPGKPGIDLTLRSGQVTAVVGLMGSGKTELAQTVFGERPLVTGAMTLDGHDYHPRHPHDAVQRGIYLVPEDRGSQALFPTWNIQRNVSIPFLQSLSPIVGLMRTHEEKHRAARLIELLEVVCPGPDAPIESLSGGNQQKVVVGRWLGGKPRLLVLDNPFVGIDVGARHDIALRLRESAVDAAVLVLTADPEEATEVADRLLVLADGRLVLDAPAADITYQQIVTSMTKEAA